jgi:hypothetical protein
MRGFSLYSSRSTVTAPRRYISALAFGPYVFGTYADGSYAVDVPYSVLKPILASDGPLGSLR